jgi:hypothetical protein
MGLVGVGRASVKCGDLMGVELGGDPSVVTAGDTCLLLDVNLDVASLAEGGRPRITSTSAEAPDLSFHRSLLSTTVHTATGSLVLVPRPTPIQPG